MMIRQDLYGAFWCDANKYPEWKCLPVSAFDKEHSCPDRMLEFRTSLIYSGNGKFLMRFTGGCRFRLYLNGEFVDDGPVEPGGDYGKKDAPNWWFYDERDLSSFLQQGDNELLLQMFPAPMTQKDYSLGTGWFWCAVAKKNDWHVLTSENWQCRLNEVYVNHRLQDYRRKNCPWTNACRPVEIPVAAYSLELPPLTRIVKKDYHFFCPFGLENNFHIKGQEMFVSSGAACTFFLVFPMERCGFFEARWHGEHEMILQFDFQEQCGVSIGATEQINTSERDGSYRTVNCYAFKYVKITAIPSFFASENNGNVAVLSFQMVERHFPLGRKKALGNVPLLHRQIDDVCLRNVVMCMQRMHLDSPVHQEGLGCTGDYRIEALAEYAAFGETRLARADLIRTALLLRQQGKMFHTSYELCFIFMAWEYVQQSGKTDFLTEYYDVFEGLYHRYLGFTGKTGLISEADNYLFVDWIVDGDCSFHHPPASRGTGVVTAMWYGALRILAKIADKIGKKEDNWRYECTATEVRNAFNRELWDTSVNAYKDGIPGLSQRKPEGWLPPDTKSTCTCSSLTSIMALANGLPEKAQCPEKLLDNVVNGRLPLRPTVYFMFYLFQAVVRYGKWEIYGLQLVEQWSFFLKNGLRESWVAGDYCHGWGASPSIFLRQMYSSGMKTSSPVSSPNILSLSASKVSSAL